MSDNLFQNITIQWIYRPSSFQFPQLNPDVSSQSWMEFRAQGAGHASVRDLCVCVCV